ncbi:metacaspase-2-like [Condylostylus longicornis]|uniref:metacaspase-2-like n=1 Tax=Condylostylus longicornis TaxID=2530218 RepID=UPI00244E102B|nr:metacaspase-2-like [Condylostylus longicornis]
MRKYSSTHNTDSSNFNNNNNNKDSDSIQNDDHNNNNNNFSNKTNNHNRSINSNSNNSNNNKNNDDICYDSMTQTSIKVLIDQEGLPTDPKELCKIYYKYHETRLPPESTNDTIMTTYNNINQIGNLNILYLNICSIRHKILELEALVQSYENVDIVILTEVWIFENEVDVYNIQNFKSLYNCRNEKRGGGTAIFVSNKLNYNEIEKNEMYNFTVIEIINTQPKVKIGTFYKAPCENNALFIEYLETRIDQLSQCIFFADVNVNILDKTNTVTKYIDMVNISGYKFINKTHSTRQTASTSTLIDHIVSNIDDQHKITYKIEDNDISDHKTTFVSVELIKHELKPFPNLARSRIDYVKMYEDVSNELAERSITEVEDLIHVIQKPKENSTTTYTIRSRSNTWITPSIINDEKDDGICNLLKPNGDVTTTDFETANFLNKYFNEIGEKIINENSSNIVQNTLRNVTNQKSVFLIPVTENEIVEIALNLNKNAAPGEDGMTVNDIQQLIHVIKKPLCNMALIVPIHKGGTKTDCGNYRPISLLNSVSKIYEKAINKRIRSFVESTIGFDTNQYGFIEESGIDSAVSVTLDHIYDALDEGCYVAGVFIDLSKAFDVVNHIKLLDFLEDLGIRGTANSLFRRYLSNSSLCTNKQHGNSRLYIRERFLKNYICNIDYDEMSLTIKTDFYIFTIPIYGGPSSDALAISAPFEVFRKSILPSNEKCKILDQEISELRITDNNPVYIKNFRLTFTQKVEINKQTENLVKNELIKTSQSNFNSQITLVPKKGNLKKWCLCMDYRQVNKDIPLDEESKDITSFSTNSRSSSWIHSQE